MNRKFVHRSAEHFLVELYFSNVFGVRNGVEWNGEGNESTKTKSREKEENHHHYQFFVAQDNI